MYMVAFVIVVFHLAEVALTAVAKEHGNERVGVRAAAHEKD